MRLLNNSLYAFLFERQGNGDCENKTRTWLKLSLTGDGVKRRQKLRQWRRVIPAALAYNQRWNHEHPIAQCAPGVLQDFNGFNLDLRPSCP
jgi:hypothetical protein